MFPTFKPSPHVAWIRSLAGLACACGYATAQDFSLQVADSNPLAIGSFVPSGLELAMDGGIEGGIKGDFAYGLGVETTYDSNFELSESNEESEISAFFAPWLRYVTDPEGDAFFSLTANYRPIFRAYQHNSDLNVMDQTADVSVTFKGGKTDVSLFARYNELSGTDRLTGTFTSGALFTGGVRANRQIASRTSINGGLSYGQSQYDSSNIEGSEVMTGYFGALWDASYRLSLGSSIRYSNTQSDNTGTRDACALLAELRYKMGERIWLSASFGPEFSSDSETDENNVGFAADFSARYLISERLSWTGSALTATVASPSEAGYLVNNVLIRTGLNYKLLRATVSGGIAFNYSDYEKVGEVADIDNEENLGLYLGYSRNLFSERVAFDTMVRYTLNEGDTEWNQWLVSAGLNIAF